MKSKLLLIVMLAVGLGAFSQGGQRRTVEERVKRVMDTVTTVFKFEANVQTETQTIFTDYYTAWDKLREATPQGERPDRTQMEKLTGERDEKLKKVLTEEQFKKFKEEIEPAIRPRRRQ